MAAMIELTRLNGAPIVLNSDLIKTAEASPDTMLTLIGGEKLIVRESCAEVSERVLIYRARLLARVARHLPAYGDLQRVVSIASLDVGGSPTPSRCRRATIRSPATDRRQPPAGAERRCFADGREKRRFRTLIAEERSMDKGSIGGVFLAVAGIVAGLLIEGGNLGQILQPTAALIVFGGTMGAVLLQFPLGTVMAAFRSLAHVFAAPSKQNEQLVRQLVAFANKARRNGVVSLDADLQSIENPFLKQALMLAVDGTEPTELRNIMRVSLDCTAESEERLPAVFESAGGFSPTIGILGAVLGLIQVMQHLDNIQEVGRGIAVAFVATIYGVGIANLFFLPFAGKMRIRMHDEHQRREMMLEGVISILEGINPRMLEVKLAGFLDEAPRDMKGRDKKGRAA